MLSRCNIAFSFRVAGAGLASMLICTSIWGLEGAGNQTVDEYYVKAGFVSSFANFIEWPAEATKVPGEPIAICVLGQNPFGPFLEQLARGKHVDGRALTVRQISEAHEAAGCYILFVSASEHLRLRAILQSLHNQSILSVGDTDDFIAEGGIVRLRLDQGRVRIDINAGLASENHLRISSSLLQLARPVKR